MWTCPTCSTCLTKPRAGRPLKDDADTPLFHWMLDHPALSYRDLSQACRERGVKASPGYLSKLARGQGTPSLKLSRALATVTEMPIESFMPLTVLVSIHDLLQPVSTQTMAT